MAYRCRSSICLVVFLAIGLAVRPAAAATALSLAQQVIDAIGGINFLEGPRALAVSSDGKHVYVLGRGDQALNAFNRDGTTGFLTFIEAERQGVGGVDGLNVGEAVAVSPDGLHVYVGSRSALVVFSRNAGTGAVTFVEAETTTFGTSAIALSADNAYLYAATDEPSSQGRIATYARDTGTGHLTFVQEVQNDTGGVAGISRVNSIAISSDDANLYATGPGDDAVAAFTRNLLTGELTFLAEYQDGMGGVSGIQSGTALVVSPDGANVYVASSKPTGVAVFGRNAGTGLLTFVASGQPANTRYLTLGITPNGAYVIGGGNETVTALTRNGGTGELTLAGGDAFASSRGIAVSPDSQFVYAGTALTAAGVFRFVSLDCTAAPQSGCPQPVESQKASLTVKDSLDDDKGDKITWKWAKGTTVALGDFGDPVTGQDAAILCVYDSSAAPQPVLEVFAPAQGICKDKPCWKFSGTTSVKYKDSLLLPDGASGMTLKAGIAGSSSIKVKGKGVPLLMPTLPLAAPVTVQLQSANGNCWEAIFSTPTVTTNELFKAKGD